MRLPKTLLFIMICRRKAAIDGVSRLFPDREEQEIRSGTTLYDINQGSQNLKVIRYL
jgi:hypothetical protein